jgi:HPt (histidine-containing phosphotransfer) domain-containing protein
VQWLRGFEAGEGKSRCGVIMLSGNDDDASVQRALAAGADRYLTKPVNRDALLAALRELEGLDADGGTTSAPPMPSPGPAVRTGAAPQPDDEWGGMLPAFIGYQRKTLDEMAAAVAAGDRLRVQFLAHRAAGGLGMLRLEWAAEQCRGIEGQASDAPLEDLGERINAVSAHLAGVEGASG